MSEENKNRIFNHKPSKKTLVLIIGVVLYEFLWVILLFNLWGFWFLDDIIVGSPYDKFAITIIGIWMMIVIPYLTWLIYFYNIRRGLTSEFQERLEEYSLTQKASPFTLLKEAPLLQMAILRENPYANETMGIPRGTIRGVLALTVSIGGFAMMVSAMGRDTTLASNQFFVDNLEFFKTAFLMVMAFYFGTKGLEVLQRAPIGQPYAMRGPGTNIGENPVSAAPINPNPSLRDIANEDFMENIEIPDDKVHETEEDDFGDENAQG